MEACKRAKVPARFVRYEGADPVAFILGANLSRRDMTKSQKAMVTAQAVLNTNTNQTPAANGAGVSQPLVSQANTILKYAPDLAPRVTSGALQLNDAYKTAQANKAAAKNAEAVLAELTENAPDLVADVIDGTTALDDAGLREGGRWKRNSVDISGSRNSGNYRQSMSHAGLILDHRPDLVGDVIDGTTALDDAGLREGGRWKYGSVNSQDHGNSPPSESDAGLRQGGRWGHHLRSRR